MLIFFGESAWYGLNSVHSSVQSIREKYLKNQVPVSAEWFRSHQVQQEESSTVICCFAWFKDSLPLLLSTGDVLGPPLYFPELAASLKLRLLTNKAFTLKMKTDFKNHNAHFPQKYHDSKYCFTYCIIVKLEHGFSKISKIRRAVFQNSGNWKIREFSNEWCLCPFFRFSLSSANYMLSSDFFKSTPVLS